MNGSGFLHRATMETMNVGTDGVLEMRIKLRVPLLGRGMDLNHACVSHYSLWETQEESVHAKFNLLGVKPWKHLFYCRPDGRILLGGNRLDRRRPRHRRTI